MDDDLGVALWRNGNPHFERCWKVYFCIVTELLGDALYDFLKWNGYRGFWLQDGAPRGARVGRESLDKANWTNKYS